MIGRQPLSLFGAALLALSACGSGAGSSASSCSGALLAPHERAAFESISSRVGLSAPEPRIERLPAAPCPGSPDQLCDATGANVAGAGIRGHYRPPTTEDASGCPGTVYVADPAVLEHEIVHHLLFHAGRHDYRDHAAPEFRHAPA